MSPSARHQAGTHTGSRNKTQRAFLIPGPWALSLSSTSYFVGDKYKFWGFPIQQQQNMIGCLRTDPRLSSLIERKKGGRTVDGFLQNVGPVVGCAQRTTVPPTCLPSATLSKLARAFLLGRCFVTSVFAHTKKRTSNTGDLLRRTTLTPE